MADIHRIYRLFFNYFRPRRLKQFRQLIPEVMNEIDILDVGGDSYQWDYLNTPARVTILNTSIDKRRNDGYSFVIGDGRRLAFADASYDLVFSNSVIEHVGCLRDQELFAKEMQRVGKMVYCQTPNRWFFIEPHLITAFVHWLPKRLQRKIIRWSTVWGWVDKPDSRRIDEFLERTRLLSYSELKALFPECRIIRERFLGFTKSFVVVRT